MTTLHHAKQRQHRQRSNHGDDRKLPSIETHDDQRSDDHNGIDDPGHSAVLNKAGDCFDIAGNARGEFATTSGLVISHRQPMNVLERFHPQVAQHHFGRRHEPHIGNSGEEHECNDDHRRRGTGRDREAAVESVVSQEAPIDYLLNKNRNDQASDCADHREQHRQSKAPAEFRTLGESSSKNRHRPKAAFVGLGFFGRCCESVVLKCNGVIERRCVFHHRKFVVGLSRQLTLVNPGVIARSVSALLGHDGNPLASSS